MDLQEAKPYNLDITIYCAIYEKIVYGLSNKLVLEVTNQLLSTLVNDMRSKLSTTFYERLDFRLDTQLRKDVNK